MLKILYSTKDKILLTKALLYFFKNIFNLKKINKTKKKNKQYCIIAPNNTFKKAKTLFLEFFKITW